VLGTTRERRIVIIAVWPDDFRVVVAVPVITIAVEIRTACTRSPNIRIGVVAIELVTRWIRVTVDVSMVEIAIDTGSAGVPNFGIGIVAVSTLGHAIAVYIDLLVSHVEHAITVVVDPVADFERWRAGLKTPNPTAYAVCDPHPACTQ